MASSLPRVRRTLLLLAALAGAVNPAVAPMAQVVPGTAPPTRITLPSLGDAGTEDLPVNTERRLGDRIMRQIWPDPLYLHDPVLKEYVQQMWNGLLAASRERGQLPPDLGDRFAWEIFLVRERSVNAFALPGGYVGVHLGLIAMTASPDELASVLAHELSHVTQRHIARSIGASKTSSMLGIATMILGVLAAGRSPDAANALITGGQAVSAQQQLNYSRDMEREADRVGYGVLIGAGYQPAGMAMMFEKLMQAARLNDSNNFPYLRSHPLTTERIGEARSRLGFGPVVPPARPLWHATMQARARVLMDPSVGALRQAQAYDSEQAQAIPSTEADRVGAAYGSALASLVLREPARAERALAQGRAAVQNDAQARRAFDLLAVQLALARDDSARAGELLQPWIDAPGGRESRAVLMLQAQRALAPSAGESALRTAAERVQTWVAIHPSDSEAWSSLSQLWARLGERVRSVRAEAESRAAIGDLPGAIERFRSGRLISRQTNGDLIEASVIESRLRELEARRRQEVLEERGQG
jgi:predicted Zn-dependent protease